ncbi:quorum-sensing sensor histidine kinase AgrC [Staphylococcus caprae]|uniref:Accessory gene regulator C n=4 Tax=Staphylococcus caprae TaxID=29380 RepID=A0ABN5W2G4_9STAP|nr:GHKL domain-containing protein [Staphylococcus caprae]MEB8095744.1 GHKL domain-containing protein [Staphylococcus caprae]QDW93520.1 GHKL domain-containing protein [Staphylococcus caprae]QJE24287.1 GHKL domain-containing protein [Staphylococcus caprae]BBD89554.1 accessory gene regulator C [Staphylococcus caprae]BBD92021.1 accessory gene regulator C [Staphylococcus caprae]
MDSLNNWITASFQLALMFYVVKVLMGVKYNIRDYIFMIGIIIPSNIVYTFIGTDTLILVIILSIIFFYRKMKFFSILAIFGSNIILYLCNFITVLLITFSEKFSDKIEYKFIIYIVSFVGFGILLSYATKFLINLIKKSYLYSNKLYISTISIFLVITFFILFIFTRNEDLDFQTFRLYTYLYVGIVLIILIILIIISYTVLREMKYKRNLEEIETYYEYTLRIESINNEMRKFRHDYVNILSTLSEFIHEDDMPGLKRYFNEQIVPLKDNMKTRSIKLNGIEKLKVREIKGLITTKILQAQEKKIPISIEVPDEIDKIDMNTIELSRITGIIIDNAIEASEALEDPLIRIAFIDNEESVTFIVMNKCSDNTPKIHELFEEGFSTKGDNRGLGLSTLKELTDENENVLLDTVIENGYFVQKVEIINTKNEA